MNQFEKTKPICRLSVGNPKSEYLNPKQVEGYVLKKQTQFMKGKNGVNLALTITYNIFSDWALGENKANSKPILWFMVRSSWFIAKTGKCCLKKQSQFAKLAQKVQNKHHQMPI